MIRTCRILAGLAVVSGLGLSLACRSAPEAEPAAEAVPNVSVTVAPVVRTTLRAFVNAWGTVEPQPAMDGEPAASARVASAVPGLVAEVLIGEGQRVGTDALLFRLDSRTVDVTIERARHAVRVAEQLAQRQERLGPGQATSQRAYDDAQAQLSAAQSELTAAELQRRLLDVTAPIAGTIVTLHARKGDAIDPSTVLAEVVDLNRLVAAISVRSLDLLHVKRGQRVEIVSAADPSAAPSNLPTSPVATTVVDYIGTEVNPANDSIVVRARMPASAAVRPGQFVTARIVTDERADRLAVPVESVVQGGAGPEVAVVDGSEAVRQRVTTGLREGGVIEVEGAGIREGVSVVVRGAYGLPPRSKITVADR